MSAVNEQQRRMRQFVLNQKAVREKRRRASTAAGLRRAGYRTLLIDLDAQGNVAVSLGLSALVRFSMFWWRGLTQLIVVNVSKTLTLVAINLAQTEVRLVKPHLKIDSKCGNRMSSNSSDFIMWIVAQATRCLIKTL